MEKDIDSEKQYVIIKLMLYNGGFETLLYNIS